MWKYSKWEELEDFKVEAVDCGLAMTPVWQCQFQKLPFSLQYFYLIHDNIVAYWIIIYLHLCMYCAVQYIHIDLYLISCFYWLEYVANVLLPLLYTFVTTVHTCPTYYAA